MFPSHLGHDTFDVTALNNANSDILPSVFRESFGISFRKPLPAKPKIIMGEPTIIKIIETKGKRSGVLGRFNAAIARAMGIHNRKKRRDFSDRSAQPHSLEQ